MTAIVTCGYTRSALVAVRSLGRANVPVAVAAPFKPALAMHSRYASSVFITPDPVNGGERFAEHVAAELSGRYAICAMVSTDDALWALSRWRDKLPSTACRILPPHRSIARALDKVALYDLAKSIDVPCIDLLRFEPDESPDTVLGEAKKMNLPLLIRAFSRRTPNEVPQVVYSYDDLLRIYTSEFIDSGCVIEHRPHGVSLSYAAVYQEGEPIAELCQERLQEEQPFSDVAIWAKTVPLSDEVRRVARKLLAALSWQGPVKIEMVRQQDGLLRIIRVIGRLWGSVQLAANAGIDVPLLCYKIAHGYAQTAHIIEGREGVEIRRANTWLRLMATLGRLVTASDAKKRNIELFQVNDPMPFIYEMQRKLRSDHKL